MGCYFLSLDNFARYFELNFRFFLCFLKSYGILNADRPHLFPMNLNVKPLNDFIFMRVAFRIFYFNRFQKRKLSFLSRPFLFSINYSQKRQVIFLFCEI